MGNYVDHQDLIETTLQYWSAQDVERTLELVSDNVVYQLYISQTALPYGGETRGKDDFRDVLFDILAQFDYLSYEPVILGICGDVARVQTRCVLHHRASGHELDMSKRSVFRIKHGLIVRIDEYLDAALVESFMRLAQWRIRENAQRLTLLSGR